MSLHRDFFIFKNICMTKGWCLNHKSLNDNNREPNLNPVPVPGAEQFGELLLLFHPSNEAIILQLLIPATD